MLQQYETLDSIYELIDDKLYFSHDSSRVSEVSADQLSEIIKNVFIITHDGDALCHYLLDYQVDVPVTMFDIRQARFLLNPLKRHHELMTVIQYEGDDVSMIMGLLWETYKRQAKALAKLRKHKDAKNSTNTCSSSVV